MNGKSSPSQMRPTLDKSRYMETPKLCSMRLSCLWTVVGIVHAAGTLSHHGPAASLSVSHTNVVDQSERVNTSPRRRGLGVSSNTPGQPVRFIPHLRRCRCGTTISYCLLSPSDYQWPKSTALVTEKLWTCIQQLWAVKPGKFRKQRIKENGADGHEWVLPQRGKQKPATKHRQHHRQYRRCISPNR